MFDTILIANRGEIACRIAATAHRMGIKTVAVYSDADAQARHLQACDMAVHIGASEPKASYLQAQKIIQAAQATGAQAIHPGYGFLAENEHFAQACAAANIQFIGPPASAIAAMGSKSAAKTLMEKAGVPLVPGYHGDEQDADFLKAQADAIGYPVLIKASAGGGGKGMRIVSSGAEFMDALSSCKREASNSFGDDKVLLERYIVKPRHIEIQVFADTHGNCVYLFERDCSVQRRHQKVIEEAPAPGMTADRRQAMGEAAVAAAKAVSYVGAGTVEFITEQDGTFYFMEMNTRLQVEHPVTEMITGHDLVEWQLKVAAGQALPVTQEQLQISGHSIEVRVYAENPDNDFLPSIGTLRHLVFPTHSEFDHAPNGVRVDRGVQAGDTISPFYDPMIAKLIVHGADREQARTKLIQALRGTYSVGVHTNIAFLIRLLADEAFAQADLDTGLIERRHTHLFPASNTASEAELALAVAGILHHEQQNSGTDTWAQADMWRLSGSYRREFRFSVGDHDYQLYLCLDHEQLHLEIGSTRFLYAWQCLPNGNISVQLNQERQQERVILDQQQVYVFGHHGLRIFQRQDPMLLTISDEQEQGGGLTAPMPGKIIALPHAVGTTVKAGDLVVIMEAMKMEHSIYAPQDGVIEEIFFALGDQVSDGVALLTIGSAD